VVATSSYRSLFPSNSCSSISLYSYLFPDLPLDIYSLSSGRALAHLFRCGTQRQRLQRPFDALRNANWDQYLKSHNHRSSKTTILRRTLSPFPSTIHPLLANTRGSCSINKDAVRFGVHFVDARLFTSLSSSLLRLWPRLVCVLATGATVELLNFRASHRPPLYCSSSKYIDQPSQPDGSARPVSQQGIVGSQITGLPTSPSS
jgi:hypothetical protein